MDLAVVPLHKNKQYMHDCCKLINNEWKRSETARIRSLESSSDQLPTSLILIQNNKVIGHLKLSSIPSIKDACFLESVVIEKDLRGRGFGSILMKKSEDYCQCFLGLKTIYLSTKGQEMFYSKLGYTECPPISIYGSYIPIQLNQVAEKAQTTIEDGIAPKPPPMPNLVNNNNTKTFMKKDL